MSTASLRRPTPRLVSLGTAKSPSPKRESVNFESYFKDPRDGSEIRKEVAINPHDNFHYGRTDQCVNCHREHRLSTVTCEKCHDIDP